MALGPAAMLLWALVGVGLAVDRCAERDNRPKALADAHRIWVQPETQDSMQGASSQDEGAPSQDRVIFWAVKDFDLSPEQIAQSERTARLLVLGDPEVQLYWNGTLVYAQHYRLGQSVSVLNVGALLEPRNRVVFEARSMGGVGGLLAALWLELPEAAGGLEQQPLWVTDEDWQTTQTFDRALLRGILPLSAHPDLRPVRTWPKLELGRWQPLVLAAKTTIPSWPSRRLQRIEPTARSSHEGARFDTGDTEPWPTGTLYVFQRPARGCLGVRGSSLFSRRVFFLDDAADLEKFWGPGEFAKAHGREPAAKHRRIVTSPGKLRWLDTAPSELGAVLLEGLEAEPSRANLASGSSVWVQPCAGDNHAEPPKRLFD